MDHLAADLLASHSLLLIKTSSRVMRRQFIRSCNIGSRDLMYLSRASHLIPCLWQYQESSVGVAFFMSISSVLSLHMVYRILRFMFWLPSFAVHFGSAWKDKSATSSAGFLCWIFVHPGSWCRAQTGRSVLIYKLAFGCQCTPAR